MNITQIHPEADYVLMVFAEDGRVGQFDVRPYLQFEAFSALHDPVEFAKCSAGGYFVEWACGADLSADTIEARWQLIAQRANSFAHADEKTNYLFN